ncbi:MAG: hypothetical protein H8D23_06015 [Candidatus Brocadiales bacterium]|nr:hypothetical protein [Candidatus Brocadiales bacterium]
MSITKSEYNQLIMRNDAGDIQFFFDPAQIKNFLYQLDNNEATSRIGNSLLFESSVIRIIQNIIEPVSLLVSVIASFAWLEWWGISAALGAIVFWMMLKSSSSGGKQHIAINLIIAIFGFFITLSFQHQGVGFIVFGIATTLLYFSVKMLYALPVRFLSKLIVSNYELFNILYENPIDEFNKEMGVPMLWYTKK